MHLLHSWHAWLHSWEQARLLLFTSLHNQSNLERVSRLTARLLGTLQS